MMIDSKAPLDRKDIVVDLRLHAAGCYHCHSDDNRGMPSLQPYMQKAGDSWDISPQFFWIFRKILG